MQFSDVRLVGCRDRLYVFQLSKVNRIGIRCSGCHLGDSRVVGVNACRGDRRTACNGKTCFAKRDVITRFEHFTAYALQSCERFAQFEFIAYFLLIRCACYRFFVISNSQIGVCGSEVRTFDGVGRSLSVFRFFRDGHIVACFDSGLAIFELGYVHRIGVCQTCGEVGDLSCFILRTDRDSAVAGFPCRIVRCRCFVCGRIVPENTGSGTCYGTCTQSHAAFDTDVGIIAENGHVRCFGFCFCFQRADNDISVHIFQLVVIAQYQVMTGIGQCISVARNDIVGQSGLAFCIGKVVAHAGNTGIDCTCYRVTVTVDSDMASFFFKETNRTFRILILTQISFQFFLFGSGHDFIIVRIIYRIAYTADKGAVGFCNIIFGS